MEFLKAFLFTFQYVSINTRKAGTAETREANLHSNMFLLIPLPLLIFSFALFNLHSNMFLLIRKRIFQEL